MIERRESHYENFIGTTAAELGFGSDVVKTSVVDHFAPNGQRVGVAVIEPHEGYATNLIMPQQHDYRNEPLSIRRAEILASRLNARVALVETPGTVGLLSPNPDGSYEVYDSLESIPGARQTPRQLLAAARGDFTDHARVQLDAVTETLNLTAADHLMLFGESMGASTATDMVGHIATRGMALDAVILHEVVNAHGRYSISHLLSLINNLGGLESERRNAYFEENEAINFPTRAFEQVSGSNLRLDKARKAPSQQGLASAVNGLAMRVGINDRLVRGLSEYRATPPAVILTRGADSAVTSASEYAALSMQLQEDRGARAPVSLEFHGEGKREVGHFFLMSLGRQANYASELRHALHEVGA